MATVSISFTGADDKDPYFPSDNVAGGNFTSRRSNAKTFSGTWYSATDALWSCDVDPAVNTFSLQCEIDLANANARGVSAHQTSGNGFLFIATSTDTRVFAMTSWALSGSALATYATTFATGGFLNVDVTQSTGTYVVKNGSTTIGTFVNTTYTSGLRGGLTSRNGGAVRSFTLTYTPAQTITSINGGNPITVGQAGVVINHTGFSGAATSVTTNRPGVTCAITAGDANSTTVTVSGWVEGGAYPVVDNSVTFTVSRSGESASASQTLTKPANYAQITFSGAILDDPNLIGYRLNAAGHVVEGGEFYNRTDQVADLIVYADTAWTSAIEGGTFNATFIPSTGATAGNAYLFDITVINGSIVSVTGGLTSVGLTSIGLTSTGLTSVGL